MSIIFDEKPSWKHFVTKIPKNENFTAIGLAPNCPSGTHFCPKDGSVAGSRSGFSEAAEVVMLAVAQYDSGSWGVPQSAIVPVPKKAALKEERLRSCRRLAFWETAGLLVVDLRRAILVVSVEKPDVYRHLPQTSGKHNIKLVSSVFDDLTSLEAKYDETEDQDEDYNFDFKNAKHRLAKNTRSSTGFVDCSFYISRDGSTLWVVDAIAARGFASSDLDPVNVSLAEQPDYLPDREPTPTIQFRFAQRSRYGPRASKNGRFLAIWKSLTVLLIVDLEDGPRAFENARSIPVNDGYVDEGQLLPARAILSDDGRYVALRYRDMLGNFALRIMDLTQDTIVRAACGLVSRTFSPSELESVYGTGNGTAASSAQSKMCANFTSQAQDTSAALYAAPDAPRQTVAPSAPIVRIVPENIRVGTSVARILTVFVFNTFSGDDAPKTATVTCTAEGQSAQTVEQPMRITGRPYLYPTASPAQPHLALDCGASRRYWSSVLPSLLVAETNITNIAPLTKYSCRAFVQSDSGKSPETVAEATSLAESDPPLPDLESFRLVGTKDVNTPLAFQDWIAPHPLPSGADWASFATPKASDGSTLLEVNSNSWLNFQDSSGASRYKINADEKWTITAPAGHGLMLEFTTFSTEYGRDFVSISDDSGEIKRLSGFLSGQPEKTTLRVLKSKLFLSFTSDNYKNLQGFTARVKSFELIALSSAAPTKELDYTFASGYLLNKESTWVVDAPTGSLIKISFSTVDVFSSEYNWGTNHLQCKDSWGDCPDVVSLYSFDSAAHFANTTGTPPSLLASPNATQYGLFDLDYGREFVSPTSRIVVSFKTSPRWNAVGDQQQATYGIPIFTGFKAAFAVVNPPAVTATATEAAIAFNATSNMATHWRITADVGTGNGTGNIEFYLSYAQYYQDPASDAMSFKGEMNRVGLRMQFRDGEDGSASLIKEIGFEGTVSDIYDSASGSAARYTSTGSKLFVSVYSFRWMGKCGTYECNYLDKGIEIRYRSL
eukprot:tig00000139_g8297.t1